MYVQIILNVKNEKCDRTDSWINGAQFPKDGSHFLDFSTKRSKCPPTHNEHRFPLSPTGSCDALLLPLYTLSKTERTEKAATTSFCKFRQVLAQSLCHRFTARGQWLGPYDQSKWKFGNLKDLHLEFKFLQCFAFIWNSLCAGYCPEKISMNLYEDLSFKGLTLWKYLCCLCIWGICT